jgi:hypothetical protein
MARLRTIASTLRTFLFAAAGAGVAAAASSASARPVALSPDLIAFAPGVSIRSRFSLPPDAFEHGEISVRLACTLDDRGRLYGCDARGEAPEDVVDLAIARSRYYLVDLHELAAMQPTALDRNGHVADGTQVELVETFRADDRRTLHAGDPGPRPDHASYAERPDDELISNFYPARALRDEIWARVRGDCEVLADERLFCADAWVSDTNWPGMPAELEHEFRMAFLAVSSAYKVDERARNGVAMAGQRVPLGMLFKIGE